MVIGSFVNNVPVGQVRLCISKGTNDPILQYTGALKQGLFSGPGKLETEEFVYNGTFQDGKFSGLGVFISRKEHYDGEFCNGLLHGPGIWTNLQSGAKYVG